MKENSEPNPSIRIISVDCLNQKEKNNIPLQFLINYSVLFSGSNSFLVKFKYIDSDDDFKKESILGTFILPTRKLGKFKTKITIKSPRFEKNSKELFFYNAAFIVSFYFNNCEFIRVGYFVHFENLKDHIENQNLQNENIKMEDLNRILSTKPLITRFSLN